MPKINVIAVHLPYFLPVLEYKVKLCDLGGNFQCSGNDTKYPNNDTKYSGNDIFDSLWDFTTSETQG